jgi:asparagine synthase (glutamine-hydrolysing)
LAIIDLSAAGHMPMEYPGEPLSLVYNGEIYNFPELRTELERSGERFFSKTDTEVILRGYRVWGDAVIERLRGMFAFALWDGRGDGRLLLARDRFGKKPLYIQQDDNKTLRFSSELKTMLHGSPRNLDPISLEYYLDRGYPPSDRCMFLGYGKVLPGQFAVWADGHLKASQYWNPPEINPAFAAVSGEEIGQGMRARLEDAVSRRLVADVPIGLLLSGGVDSTSLLVLMSRCTEKPIVSYTACFGASDLDESEQARQSALFAGSRHHAILINPRSGRLLPFVASQMDEPIADASAIATYLICRSAREEVTVLLTGDGSDELLLGYPRYRLHAAAHTISRIMPSGLRKVASRLSPPWSILERTLSAPEEPLRRDRYWLDHARRRLGAFEPSGRHIPVEETIRRVLCEDVKTWLLEDILMKVDKMSMASSVEIRAPFLDQVLAEWVMALPVSTRMSLWRGKLPLYRAMRNLVPPHLSWFRNKPFHLPINEWLSSEWRPLAQDVLLDDRTTRRGWVDRKELRQLLDEHLSGKSYHGRRLYQLLILELWARSMVDKGEAEAQPASIDDCVRELTPDRPVRRVAVIAPAGIGNTARLTPALVNLGRSDPNISVTLYTARGLGSDEVMAGLAPVDRHILIDFSRSGLGKLIKLVREIKRSSPDLLVSTWVSRLSGIAGLLSGVAERRGWAPQWSLSMRLSSIFWKKQIPYDHVQRDIGRYDTAAFSRALEADSLPYPAPVFALPIWEEGALSKARKRLAKLARPLLAVNAVAQASIPQREYPMAHMAQALEELLHRGVVRGIVLLGNDHSRSCHGPLVKALGSRVLDLSGVLSLTASAAVMRECDAVLSIDGGLLHVALSTNLPVIAIYGPTFVYSEDPREESGGYVAVSAFADCRCLCLNHCGICARPECQAQSTCLASIPPERIVESVSDQLKMNQKLRAHGGSSLD